MEGRNGGAGNHPVGGVGHDECPDEPGSGGFFQCQANTVCTSRVPALGKGRPVGSATCHMLGGGEEIWTGWGFADRNNSVGRNIGQITNREKIWPIKTLCMRAIPVPGSLGTFLPKRESRICSSTPGPQGGGIQKPVSHFPQGGRVCRSGVQEKNTENTAWSPPPGGGDRQVAKILFDENSLGRGTLTEGGLGSHSELFK